MRTLWPLTFLASRLPVYTDLTLENNKKYEVSKLSEFDKKKCLINYILDH